MRSGVFICTAGDSTLADKHTRVLTYALKEDLKRKAEVKRVEEIEKQEWLEQKRQEKMFRKATLHSPVRGLIEATPAAEEGEPDGLL